MIVQTLSNLDGLARAYSREADKTKDATERRRVTHELECVQRARKLLQAHAPADEVYRALSGE